MGDSCFSHSRKELDRRGFNISGAGPYELFGDANIYLHFNFYFDKI